MSEEKRNPAARTPASTQSEMTEIILPNDTNILGNLLGGRLMHFIDLTGAMAANRAFSSSMEVGVKVWAENTRTGEVAHVASAYLVFVAIDQHGRLVKVPALQPETPDEQRRFADAQRRRQHREAESARRKAERQQTGSL
jgi:acyl-CoA hydrolase